MSNNKRANKQEKKEDKGKVINPKYHKHRKGSAKNRHLDQKNWAPTPPKF